MEDVHTVDLHLHLATLRREEIDVRLAENDEEVALAGVLQIVGHVQVGVHARLEHGDAAELVELRGMGVVVEGAGDEHVEVGIAGLARGGQPFKQLDGPRQLFQPYDAGRSRRPSGISSTLPPLE